MGYNIDYLLRYVSMDTYNKIINNNNDYVLGLLSDNYIDVNLNIKYLIKYGVSNIDKIVYNNINDFIVSHSEFINVIKNYEKSLSKDEIIMLYENKQEDMMNKIDDVKKLIEEKLIGINSMEELNAIKRDRKSTRLNSSHNA